MISYECKKVFSVYELYFAQLRIRYETNFLDTAE
jgi:hypothetical protein